jgi:hypothetical protein
VTICIQPKFDFNGLHREGDTSTSTAPTHVNVNPNSDVNPTSNKPDHNLSTSAPPQPDAPVKPSVDIKPEAASRPRQIITSKPTTLPHKPIHTMPPTSDVKPRSIQLFAAPAQPRLQQKSATGNLEDSRPDHPVQIKEPECSMAFGDDDSFLAEIDEAELEGIECDGGGNSDSGIWMEEE